MHNVGGSRCIAKEELVSMRIASGEWAKACARVGSRTTLGAWSLHFHSPLSIAECNRLRKFLMVEKFPAKQKFQGNTGYSPRVRRSDHTERSYHLSIGSEIRGNSLLPDNPDPNPNPKPKPSPNKCMQESSGKWGIKYTLGKVRH